MYNKNSTENMIILNNLKYIPMDGNNRDYQEFLEYLSDNNLTLDDIPEN